MSLVVERFLICDGNCGLNYGVDDRSSSAEEHRKRASKCGWVFSGGKDYCPVCKSKKKLKNTMNRLAGIVGIKDIAK